MATKSTKATAKPAVKPAAKTPVLKADVKPAAEKKVETKVEKKIEEKPTAKAAVKPAAKTEKPAAKAAKKTVAKKTTPKPIKTNLTIEFAGKSKTEEEIVKLAKRAWKKSGKKMADIKTIDAFVQPENNCVYCVVNGEELGAISLDGEM